MTFKKALKDLWRALPRVRFSLEWPEPVPEPVPEPMSEPETLEESFDFSKSYWVFYEPYHIDGEPGWLPGIGVHYVEALDANGLMPSLMETSFIEGLKTGRDLPESFHQGVVNILAVPAQGYPTEKHVRSEYSQHLWLKGKLFHFGPDFRMREGNTYLEQAGKLNVASQQFRKTLPKNPKFLN